MNYIYFSASGTTKETISILSKAIGGNAVTYDLLRNPPEVQVTFGKDEPALFAFPVFGGRLPVISPEMIKKFKGDKTPAIAIVVYGNRAYDDALLELTDLLSGQGFITVAAASFVAQHSIFPEVASGRPDAEDRKKIISFAEAVKEKLLSPSPVEVKGKRPYVKAGTVSLHPTGDGNCNGCGTCVRVCPVNAIPAENPKKTDTRKCIACTACIAACPRHSRAFHVPVVYPLVSRSFKKSNSVRKEPEIFL